MTLHNANLKKRIMATMVAGAVAFGGAAVVAPAADADVRITSQYSALDSAVEQAVVDYNKQQAWDDNARLAGQYQTPFGPGWCIDAHLAIPTANTAYEVRKLDGTSGFYGFNGDMGGNLKIDEDIERAAINLTKLMLTDLKQGKYADAKAKNTALQALLSNNKETLNALRGWIGGNRNVHVPGVKPVTKEQFLQWTGFEVRKSYFEQTGQANYYLALNDAVSSRLNVKDGEYVTILLPRSYNVYENLSKEPTNQRIVTIAQPGLEGFEPDVKEEPKPSTSTTTTVAPGPTVTETTSVTAAPETKVESTTVTSTQREEKTTTKVVERYFRHFSYAFDFRFSEKSEEIEVKDLGSWEIDFVDDSNGLVEVTKEVREDGTAILKITPKKKGSGKVRIVVVDSEGNRHEYVIDVVNESTTVETTGEVTVNNHYFNVGVSGVNQSIDIPAGWDYEIVSGGGLITTEVKDGKLNVKINDGVLKGNVRSRCLKRTTRARRRATRTSTSSTSTPLPTSTRRPA